MKPSDYDAALRHERIRRDKPHCETERDQIIEEIAQFAETHYCTIDANSLSGYKICGRQKHPNEPFARAIRGMMSTGGGSGKRKEND